MQTVAQKTRWLSLLCVALQVFILPATHVLHIGCSDSDCCPVVEESSHSCSFCERRAEKEQEPSQDDPHEPHDSDSCAVCQTAFAQTIASPECPELNVIGEIALVVAVKPTNVESPSEYSEPTRGPPTFC